MATHPKDRTSRNPRVQCSVCGKWKRQYQKELNRFGDTQQFYGGCSYRNGDHLAGDHIDVCVGCCDTECRKLATPEQVKETDALRADLSLQPHT
jgi:hypothetical protein